jgi:uncharacterized protein (DUF58 family)
VKARRATLALAVALVLVAAAFGTSSLYVPGIGLLLALGGALAWVRLAARRAQVVMKPGPRSTVEGELYPIDVVVRAGGLPLPGGRVTHPLARGSARVGARVRLELTGLRRGWRQLDPVTLTVTDPLGIAGAEVRGVGPGRVLVLPRVEPVETSDRPAGAADGSAIAGAGAPHGVGLRGRAAAQFEIDGLRSYRHGSPASRIHWPILARTGELVERRLVGGGNAAPLVVLDAESPADSEALDRAVRAAASLCVHLARGSGCSLLLPGQRAPCRIDPELRLWTQAHALLAVVDGGSPLPDRRIAPHGAAVFYVSASAAIPRVAAAIGGATRYLVTPSPLESGDPLFTVAGCLGQRLRADAPRGAARERAA